jgi:aerobic-type carbon monoxide dehydrogenase small subunit (CoxS/CutS family)
MSEKDKKESGEISRRQFLAGTGLVVAGGAIGAGIAIPLASDGDGETITEFICPYDNQEFATLAALEAHLDAVHGGEFAATPNGGNGVQAIPGAVTLTVNGVSRLVKVKPGWPLSFVLREKFGLIGTKVGCDRGECGACTIIVGGRTALSCTILAIEAEGLDILTIEGLADGPTLHPVQQRFLDNDTFQCGYCTPGMIMSAVALLDRNPNPTLDEAREAISGNLCFCGDYTRIVSTIANVPINVIGGA